MTNKTKLFVYGELRDEMLVTRLLGSKILRFQNITLEGYKKIKINKDEYSIEENTGSKVIGDIIEVNAKQLAILDEYEQGYERITVSPSFNGRKAQSYIKS